MPVHNFAQTAEEAPLLEKACRVMGIGIAGGLIGFGIGNYVTVETGIVEPTADLLCDIGFESRCDVVKPETQGSPLGTLGSTLLLGGLVTVVSGMKRAEQNIEQHGK